MLIDKNIFYKKKILIYGLGKSGLSVHECLKKKNKIYLYDDRKILTKKKNIKKKIISYKNVIKNSFDFIILSPGININKCILSKYLKKNLKKINTDLDIFYSLYKVNKKITITGTNGKSTTAKILHNVLKDQNFDSRLVGNIGNPILLEKNITKKTIFVIEASSYQLEYSKFFKSDYVAVLNITPDHLERHQTLKNYINAKFKLVKNQSTNGLTFLNIKNLYIKKKIENIKIISKIIKIDKNIDSKFIEKIDNPYFKTNSNKENLLFVIEISKKLKLKKNSLIKTLKKFKGLKYRQQIIYKSKSLTIINDSKSTSFSSSISLLKSLKNVYWIVGGLAKKGDQFLLTKNECKNFHAYVFGKDKDYFIKNFKDIIDYQYFKSLKFLIKKALLDIKNEKNNEHKTIFFSPAAASFDNFKNFEERGKYFNKLIKKIINV